MGGIGLFWLVGSLLLAALPVQRGRSGGYSRKDRLWVTGFGASRKRTSFGADVKRR
jgi:hypothetical protein